MIIRKHNRQQHGFTIIELMVGIAMALLTTYAIMVSYKSYEGQKRTSAAAADSFVNSQFLLNTFQRELSMAGYGFQTGRGGIGCDFSGNLNINNAVAKIFPTINEPANIPMQTALGTQRLLPVLIFDGGGNAPDAIRVMYGGSALAVPQYGSVSLNTFSVSNGGSMAAMVQGDLALLAKSPLRTAADTNCQIAQMTTVAPGGSPNQVVFATGLGPCFKGSCAAGSAFNAAAALSGATTLTNLGTLTINSYFIQGGGTTNKPTRLVQNSAVIGNMFNGTTLVNTAPSIRDGSSSSVAAMTNLVSNVVNIQAQYGIDTTNDDGLSKIDQWVDATGSYAPASITASAARQIRSVRLAMAIRSPLPETKKTAGVCTASDFSRLPNYIAATPSMYPFRWPDNSLGYIDVAQGASTTTAWNCYRYQVVTSVVPLRNLIWSTPGYETDPSSL